MTLTNKMKTLLLTAGIFSALIAGAQTLDQAKKFTSNEQFENADKAFKALIMAKPTDGDLFFFEGENFFNWDNVDSAKAAYQKGITINATDPLNYVGLGKVQWYAGDSKSAEDNFYKAQVLSKSKDAKVLDNIAKAYINAPTKDLKKAIDLLTQAISLDGNNADLYIDMGDAYLARNDGSNAATYYDKATSLNPKSALGTLRLGQLYERARNYDLSFQYYQKATQIDSTFAPAYREKAEMLHSAGRNDEAVTQYKKYLQLNDAPDARRRYGSFLFVAKKYADAISELQKVLPKDTNNVIVYRILGYSQYETGDYKNGLNNINKFFQKAAKANTKIIGSDYTYQGKLLSKTGQDSLAIIKLKQAMKKDSNSTADISSLLGNMYYKNSKCDSATKYFQMRTNIKVPALTVNDYNYLGRAAYCNKQYQKADSAFAVIVKYMVDLPLGYLWRAYCNASIDSNSTQGLAKPYYEQYVSKAAKDSLKNKDGLISAYNYLGFYYVSNKDYDKAEYYYKKTLELDPKDPTAPKGIKNIELLKHPAKKEGNK
jgi:tetratricopeptide (TPR) repeat protein